MMKSAEAAVTELPSASGSESSAGYAAVIVAAMLGEYSLLIMPFIVTAMMQGYGLSEVYAGNLVSAQLVTMGVAGIVVSYALRKIAARAIVVGAALIIAVANAICAIGQGEAVLVIGRCLTGLGEGSLMAAAGAIAAGVPNAHRLFSLLGLVIAAVAAAALIITPYLFDYIGARGVFWLLTCSPLAVLATARWLPARTAGANAAAQQGAFSIPGALRILASFALLWIGASALWVFAERIGTAGGLTLGQVGSYLAIGQVAGLLGPVAAARFGERLGLRTSIVAGNAVMAAAGLVMVYGRGAFAYGGGSAFLSIAVMFLAPCYRSLMAGLDLSGRVVAVSVAFYTFGFGLAPAVVGVLHSADAGYGTVATLATAAFVASGVLALLVHPPAEAANRQ
jgi:predicted MFS family arabinose efflux permease